MDKNNFHYQRSIFSKWAEKRTAWGEWWHSWSGPESWKNKYFPTGSKVVDFLQRTAFVAVTDLWHASQFLMFTAYQIAIAFCLIDRGYMLGVSKTWLACAIWVIILKALHGIIFNPTFHKLLERPAAEINITFGNNGEQKAEENYF